MAEKTALITAHNKSGVVTLAEMLNRSQHAIVSYGGTAAAIEKACIPVIHAWEFLGDISLRGEKDPESGQSILRRHQKERIAAELGFRLTMTEEQLSDEGLLPGIDMAYVNLKPPELIINEAGKFTGIATDVGGVSLIRSAFLGQRHILTQPDQISDYTAALMEGREPNQAAMLVSAMLDLQAYDQHLAREMTENLAQRS